MIEYKYKVILWINYFEATNAIIHLQYNAVISLITLGPCDIVERRNEGKLCEFWLVKTASVYWICCIIIRVLLSLYHLIHFFQLVLGHHHAKPK